MTALIDYGAGNLKSVFNALDLLGEECRVTSNPADLVEADRIILPGVGAFGECMRHFIESGMRDELDRQVLSARKPFLGICVGMQMLADRGFEQGEHAGLGYIAGEVRRIVPTDPRMKVPHTGWNDLEFRREHPLLKGILADRAVYFTHSYCMVPASDSDIVAVTEFGGPVVAAVGRGNIFATQFHPEKSQRNGLRILENFLSWNP